MQRAMYPMPFMKVTQGYGSGSHAGTYAIDDGGSDTGIDYLIAPFDCVVKRIYTSDANEVWVESLNPVLYADGTVDYMCMMFLHDNDVSNLWVGKIIKQGERFYEEGGKGLGVIGKYPNHTHFECGLGKFSGTGWYKNSYGKWTINNGKKPEECLWIDDSYHILNTGGYNWKHVSKTIGNPVSRDETVNQVEILVDDLRCRKTPNGDVLGYVNKGIYNYSNAIEQDGYWWFEIGKDMWIATAEGWTINYLKKEEGDDPKLIAELQQQLQNEKNKNQQLESEKAELNRRLNDVEQQFKEVKTDFETKLAEQPKLIFECNSTDDYVIKLFENEKIYIKKEG